MAELSSRKIRKSNFSPEEIETLVNTVSKHYNILYGEFAKRAINKHARHRVWLDVTKQVNRVSIERRTLQEVKNKWKKCQHLYKEQEKMQIPEEYEYTPKMKTKTKHRSSKNGKRLKIRQCAYYEPDFKKAVVLYAEEKSTSEAKRRYGISESNIRRWRRLKNDIMEKASQEKEITRPTRKCKKANSTFEGSIEDFDASELSNSLDSMPLEQRLSKISTDEPVLQSQPLSPTKLKVTRQTTKPSPSPKPPTPDPPNEEVCLRWNSHHSNMQTTFPNLLLREQYVDATLVAEGQTLKCHRLILSSCSPYFEEVLSGISPFQHPVLFMKDIPFWILKSLCDFMYAGEVHIFQNRLEELLSVAETLKIKGLAGKQENAVGSEEAKPVEPPKPAKEEKKEEREVRERKRHTQSVQNEAPTNRKPTKSTHTSRRSEKANKEIAKSDDILDPLDLLEPVYEELTKESKALNTVAKSKENKPVPVRRSFSKKLKKRKLSDEREESPPPLFLSRKGTRSRPNVKVPKFYHPPYERPSKSVESESTIVREPHTDQADPLLHIDQIKSEPLDLEDNVIEIEDNVVGFTDQDMPLRDEEIIGNYDSPLVNINEDKPEEIKEDNNVTFKKINLVQQPIIMDVHSIAEAPETLNIVSVAEIENPSEASEDKAGNIEAESDLVEDQLVNKDDPLDINTEKIEDSINTVTEDASNEVAEGENIGFHIQEVVGGEEVEKENIECTNTTSEENVEKDDENSCELGFHIAKVASEQIAANEESKSDGKNMISDDCSGELGFQITSVVSGQFDLEGKCDEENASAVEAEILTNNLPDVTDDTQGDKEVLEAAGATSEQVNELTDVLSDETRLIAESLEELLDK